MSQRPKTVDGLVGRWTAHDPWKTDVMLAISKRGASFHVRAVDQSDDEEAEIYDVKATTGALSFAAYWSSGRFTKYRLRVLQDGQLEATYTYSDTTHFKRANRKPRNRKA